MMTYTLNHVVTRIRNSSSQTVFYHFFYEYGLTEKAGTYLQKTYPRIVTVIKFSIIFNQIDDFPNEVINLFRKFKENCNQKRK